MLLRRSLPALVGLLGAPALAQGRPTRLLIPYPPAGTSDLLCRPLAEALTPILGSTVMVENRPGASTAIATEVAFRAPPDGRTLLVAGSGQIINQHIRAGALPYDFARDFVPVGMFAELTTVMLVGPSLRATTVREVIAEAKSRPGALTFGSSGPGTSNHLAGVLFCQLAGVEMLHVPYRGAAAAMTEMVAGRLDVMLPNVPEALGFVRDGVVRALAIASAHRSAALPKVPRSC